MKKSTRFKDLTNDEKRKIVQNLSYLPHHKKPYFPPIKFQDQEEISRQLSNLLRKMKSFSQRYEGKASLVIKQCMKSLQEQVDGKKQSHHSLHRSYEYYHRQILSLNSSFSQMDDSNLETQLSKGRKIDLRKIESRKLIERPKPNNINYSSIKDDKKEINNLREILESKNKLISNFTDEIAILKTRLLEIQSRLNETTEKLSLAHGQSCSLANINSDLTCQLQFLKNEQQQNKLRYSEQLKWKEIKISELEGYLQIREEEIKTLWQAYIQHPLHIS